jgi:hypothetical protein
MSSVGSVFIQGLRFNNHTVAASLNGTAVCTVLGTVSCNYARGWEVFNMSLRNVELIVGGSLPVTAANAAPGIFVPGTASAAAIGLGVRQPCAVQSGYVVYARTTENTPVTFSSTTPLYINLWA